jgi:quinol-cytochrome oxidoreductase complex cytochrome b subunit
MADQKIVLSSWRRDVEIGKMGINVFCIICLTVLASMVWAVSLFVAVICSMIWDMLIFLKDKVCKKMHM